MDEEQVEKSLMDDERRLTMVMPEDEDPVFVIVYTGKMAESGDGVQFTPRIYRPSNSNIGMIIALLAELVDQVAQDYPLEALRALATRDPERFVRVMDELEQDEPATLASAWLTRVRPVERQADPILSGTTPAERRVLGIEPDRGPDA